MQELWIANRGFEYILLPKTPTEFRLCIEEGSLKTILSVKSASRTAWVTALLLILVGGLPAQTVTFEEASTGGYAPGAAAGGKGNGITVGPDGSLWFGLFATAPPAIGRLTTLGEYTQFTPAMPPYSNLGGITSGGGTLWFTEGVGDKIGNLSLSGVLLGEYPVKPNPPYPFSVPTAITEGPDQAVWFVESNASRIGRLDENTKIMQEWDIPQSYPSPRILVPGSIVSGPDGALWFTYSIDSCGSQGEQFCSGVGTFSPQTQAFTMYPLSAKQSGANIAMGTDGYLWLSNFDIGVIAKMTTKGAITKFNVPGTTQPLFITAGPDDAMWFSGYASFGTPPFVLGRITSDGVVKVFDLPANSIPNSLMGYPGLGLWFGDLAGKRMLHAVLDPDPSTVNRMQQPPPIKLGTSGSNINDLGTCATGTLGSLVSKVIQGQTVTYILSNNHVLARENLGGQTTAKAQGDEIIHVGYLDAVPSCGFGNAVTVAILDDFEKLKVGGVNYYDAAIARTGCSQCVQVDPQGTILEIGAVSSATALPTVEMQVMKAGRTTGYSSGSIVAIHVKVIISYPSLGPLEFGDQIMISPGVFSSAGDSGSLVVNTTRNPIGLLFAGNPNFTLASPVDPILKKFGVTFVGSLAATPVPSTSVGNAKIEAASAVKDRYDDYLLKLPEAQGHGVGYSSSGSGQAVIKLFVRKATDAARNAAPRSLEGVPVEIIETGEFRSY